MPRIRESNINKRDRELIAVIRKYTYITGTTIQDVSISMRMSEATYYNRLKNPGNFSIEEIRKLSKKLNIPQEEILSCIL